MMIEDTELRNIFKTASEEHLQNLDNGLLHLEKHPDDQSTLEALLREAHSLKGDANMLGVKGIGALAHQIEHILMQLKQREAIFSQELGDRLSQGITAIHKLLHEAVTGETADVNSFQVLAALMGGEPHPEQPAQAAAQSEIGQAGSEAAISQFSAVGVLETGDSAGSISDLISDSVSDSAPDSVSDSVLNSISNSSLDSTHETPAYTSSSTAVTAASTEPGSYQPAVPSPHHAAAPASNPSTYRIETIRVSTRSLDSLMTQAGELTVTKIRIAHRLADIEAIASLWEEWSRDLLKQQRAKSKPRSGMLSSHLHNHHAETQLEQMDALLNQLRNALYEDTARLELLSSELEEGIRTLRLLPFSTIFNLFPRMVRDLARQEDKQVELIIEGEDTRADKRILEDMKDPLMHLLRNAIDHGIEPSAERQRLGKPPTATIQLRSYQTPTHIVIEVKDDGCGLDLSRIKQTAVKRGLYREEELEGLLPGQIQSLIFAPGFSTAPLVTEVSGRGVGLDVVQTNVEKLKGTIQVESNPGQGCLFRIQLGVTLATAHVLIVLVNDISYAIPVEFIRTACLIKAEEIFTLEGRDTIVREGQPLSVARLADLLELQRPDVQVPSHALLNQQSCLILQVGTEQLGILVDAVVDEQDVVIKPQSRLLKRVRNILGATILGTGDVCMILNPQDLLKSVQRRSPTHSLQAAAQPLPEKQTILLVEDSIATRTQEKRMLEAAGYEVVTAVDGNDGLSKLQTRVFDAVISDVQMPNLDGLQLTSKIRQHREYDELPIVLVTSLASDEDKRRGAEAGANAYITKSSLNQDILLETLHRLM